MKSRKKESTRYIHIDVLSGFVHSVNFNLNAFGFDRNFAFGFHKKQQQQQNENAS
jgi:hypothetical protein